MRRLLLICCLAISLVAMGAPLMAQQGDRRDAHRSRRPEVTDAEREKARLRIGITKEQQQQLEAILRETSKSTKAVYDQLRARHAELLAVYDAYEIDRRREQALIKEIGRLRMRLLQIHSEHEKKVRQVLSKEQHERLRALMREALEASRRQWGKRPPPPPGDH